MQLARFIHPAKRAQVKAQLCSRIHGSGIVITEALPPIDENLLV
jgi:hypothetical protein